VKNEINKMPEPIALWIVELRSGKYEQSTNSLQNKLGFCSLGVACCTARNNGIEVVTNEDGVLKGHSLDSQEKTLEWLKLKGPNGLFKGCGFNGHYSLVNLNDNLGLSFEKIADFIEERWKDLVKINVK